MKVEQKRLLKTLKLRYKASMVKKRLLKTLKFGHKASMVKECRCPLCALRVDIKEFRNKVFIREFETTGLCQGCLDLIYGYKVAW